MYYQKRNHNSLVLTAFIGQASAILISAHFRQSNIKKLPPFHTQKMAMLKN